MNAPIFIVGANRSGTTLLRLVLNSHSRIAIPDEFIYFNSYIYGKPVTQWHDPGFSPDQYEAFVDHFLEKHGAPLFGLDFDELRSTILEGPNDLRRPYKCALEAWARHHGKARWGEKTPGNLFYADIIREMFPEAQFIYMVRDPRAGVASMQKVSFLPDDIVFNALNRRKHATEGREVLEQHVPPEQRMTLRYEDLARQPERMVREVCAFLNEPFEPSMLHFHQDADAYMKDEAADSYNATATQPISDEHIDRWRSELTPTEVALIESICAREMEEFGYPPYGQSLPLRGMLERVVKELYWNWKMYQERHIRHYTVKYPMFAQSRSRIRQLVDWES